MRTIIIFSCLFMSLQTYAGVSLPMQPGRWEIRMQVNDGKEKQEMQEEPEAKNVCYTGYEINELENLVTKNDDQCKTKVLERTVKLIRTEFVCKDGTRGTGLWELKSPKTYSAQINSTGPKGAIQKVYEAEFVSAKCKKRAISSR